jgi:hypothetical protein
MCRSLKRTMSNTLDFISTDDLPGTTTFLQNINSFVSPSQRCTGYSDTSPTSLSTTNSSSTKRYSNIRHSTLGYDLKFKHRNFRAFSIQSLAANSECLLVHSKFRHPQGPSNTNSKRRNQPIHSAPIMMFASLYTPMNSSPHSTATKPQAPASILAPRPAYQILAICNTCISCL